MTVADTAAPATAGHLVIDGLHLTYGRGTRAVPAVRGVDLDVAPGETVGIVGESGCGKSTLGRMVAGLLAPTAGTIELDGADLSVSRSRAERRRVQMVFQHPGASLNPKLRVAAMLDEPLRMLLGLDRDSRTARIASLLELVGLDGSYGRRFSSELSGGQQQRVAIARALAAEPAVLVLDEPTASLDQSVRARIVALLRQVQAATGCTSLFISHDLDTIGRIADRVAVMYLGRVVELAAADELFARPRHPYTEALISAAPRLDPADRRQRVILPGETPNPAAVGAGCAFRGRCALAHERCFASSPALLPVGAADAAPHLVECFAVEARGSQVPPKAAGSR